MITFNHKLIFSDPLPSKVSHKQHLSKSKKNQFMIESDQIIDTLSGRPPKKVGGPKRWVRTNLDFYVTKNEKIIF